MLSMDFKMNSFGGLLKNWRKARAHSQHSLSALTGVSQRYISYLETGKSHPSRGMVTALADALAVPNNIRQQMLQASDYASAGQTNDDATFSVGSNHLKQMVAIQQPVPALVVDSVWNIVEHNPGLEKLLGLFGDAQQMLAQAQFIQRPNLLKLFYLAASMCSQVQNGSLIGRASLAKLNRQAQLQPDNTALQQLVLELQQFGKAPRHWWQYPEDNNENGELLLSHGDLQLRVMVMVSAFQNDDVDQCRIITFLPLDEVSHQLLAVPAAKTK